MESSGPKARAEMLIRRPVNEVFEAFVSPEILVRFWLSAADSRLEVGRTTLWSFMVPGAHAETKPLEIEKDRKIVVQWPGPSTATWTFEERDGGHTKVTVCHTGFEGEDILEQVVESTGGFTLVLSDLKVLLETGRSPGLVRDKAELIAEQIHQ